MKHMARTVRETYYQWYGEDVYYFNVLKRVLDIAGQVPVLYPNSFSRITPSFLFSRVTYVDVDAQLKDFFASDDLREFILRKKRYKEPTDIYFLNSYFENPTSLTKSFGLLVALSVGGMLKIYASYLLIGGWLLVSNYQKAAYSLARDENFRLVKEISQAKNGDQVIVRDAQMVDDEKKFYLFQKVKDSEQRAYVEELFPCVRIEQRSAYTLAGIGFLGDIYQSREKALHVPHDDTEQDHGGLGISTSEYSKILKKFHRLYQSQKHIFQSESEFYQVEMFDEDFFQNGMITVFLGSLMQESVIADFPFMKMTIPADEFAVFSLTRARFKDDWMEDIMTYISARLWNTGSYWLTHFLPQSQNSLVDDNIVAEVLVPIIRE